MWEQFGASLTAQHPHTRYSALILAISCDSLELRL